MSSELTKRRVEIGDTIEEPEAFPDSLRYQSPDFGNHECSFFSLTNTDNVLWNFKRCLICRTVWGPDRDGVSQIGPWIYVNAPFAAESLKASVVDGIITVTNTSNAHVTATVITHVNHE